MIMHPLEISSILPVALAVGRHQLVGRVFFGGKDVISLDAPVAMLERTDKILDHSLPACQELTGDNGGIGDFVQFSTSADDSHGQHHGEQVNIKRWFIIL